jgi:hypothetical protein
MALVNSRDNYPGDDPFMEHPPRQDLTSRQHRITERERTAIRPQTTIVRMVITIAPLPAHYIAGAIAG